MKLFQKFTIYAGCAAQIIAFFALIIWVQLGDQECILESTSIVSQIRMCDLKYSPDFVQPSLFSLAIIVFFLIAGKMSVFFARKNTTNSTRPQFDTKLK